MDFKFRMSGLHQQERLVSPVPPIPNMSVPASALLVRRKRKAPEAALSEGIERADAKKARTQLVLSAVAWCREHKKRGWECVKQPEYAELNAQTINRWNDANKQQDGRSTAQGILLPYELKDLRQWLVKSANNKNPATYKEITDKIVRILLVRKGMIRKGGRTVAGKELSHHALALLASKQLSDKWFCTFFADNPDLKHSRPKSISHKRQKKYTEKTVDRHFNGRAGLKRELEDAGILEGDGTILQQNVKRVCNRDETPQFLDYNQNAGNAVAHVVGAQQQQLVAPELENRACRTVDMVWGLDGFQYGLHVIFPKKNTTGDQVPEDCVIFNDRILEETALSTYGLISNTEDGIQTQVTLLERYEMLVDELDERGIEPLASGCRIVETSDGHSTRKGIKVMDYCNDQGIWQWLEEADTSGIFQALDQYNKKFHIYYNKTISEFKIQYGNQITVVNNEWFMKAMSFMWLSWSTRLDRIKSFRSVGLSQGGQALRPDLIDRSNFILDLGEDSPAVSPIKVEIISPVDERAGSANYWRKKFEQAMVVVGKFQERPVLPSEAGVLEPKPPKQTSGPKRVTINSGHGSIRISKAREDKHAKLLLQERGESLAAAKADAREYKAAVEWQDWVNLSYHFELCENGCVCAKDDACLAKILKKCNFCGDIKKNKCSKRLCKESSMALTDTGALLAIEF